MKVEADFTNISSSTEPLEEGTYRFKLLEVIDQADDEEWKTKNATVVGASPAWIFVSEVQEGDRVGAQHRDYVYLKTKEGKPSKQGLGRVKGYTEAILGKEAANSAKGLDTDPLLLGEYMGFIKKEAYADKSTVPPTPKTSMKLAKLFPVG